MTVMRVEILACLFVVFAYQAWITSRLVKAVEYSRNQKLSQFVIIWFIPVLGAALVHFVLSSSTQPLPKSDHAFIQQSDNSPGYSPEIGHDV
jgi:hypothetical protein